MLFDFGFFREQTCIVACPYGRFQSVMLDRNSLIVSYDKRRGEPRGRGKPTTHDASETTPAAGTVPDLSLPILRTEGGPSVATAGASPTTSATDSRTGDCVDCGMCVTTCPTGIDIRQGLQMECVSCTQCIDACDAVMTKLHRPTGLIRYTSQASLEYASGQGPKPSLFRWRILLYPLIILIVGSAFLTLLLTASPVDISLARARGLPFNTLSDGRISNQMNFKLTSRSPSDQQFTVTIEGPGAPKIELAENPVALTPGQVHAEPVIVSMNRDGFQAGSAFALIKVADTTGRIVATRSISLIGPAAHHDDGHDKDKDKEKDSDKEKPHDR
jgi:cytochrome c oxidase accessory protein FixG